jgi:hypothetical protein
VFYKHTTSAYGGPKGDAFSDHWPEVYSSFPKSPSGRNINFFVSYIFRVGIEVGTYFSVSYSFSVLVINTPAGGLTK